MYAGKDKKSPDENEEFLLFKHLLKLEYHQCEWLAVSCF